MDCKEWCNVESQEIINWKNLQFGDDSRRVECAKLEVKIEFKRLLQCATYSLYLNNLNNIIYVTFLCLVVYLVLWNLSFIMWWTDSDIFWKDQVHSTITF